MPLIGMRSVPKIKLPGVRKLGKGPRGEREAALNQVEAEKRQQRTSGDGTFNIIRCQRD